MSAAKTRGPYKFIVDNNLPWMAAPMISQIIAPHVVEHLKVYGKQNAEDPEWIREFGTTHVILSMDTRMSRRRAEVAALLSVRARVVFFKQEAESRSKASGLLLVAMDAIVAELDRAPPDAPLWLRVSGHYEVKSVRPPRPK